MSYIVWRDNSLEGWSRSDEFDTLEECFHHIAADSFGHPYIITKPVEVAFLEAEEL